MDGRVWFHDLLASMTQKAVGVNVDQLPEKLRLALIAEVRNAPHNI